MLLGMTFGIKVLLTCEVLSSSVFTVRDRRRKSKTLETSGNQSSHR